MERGGRTPAPGELKLVQAFLNTNDIDGQRDAIGTPDRLRRWLVRRSLLAEDAAVGYADLRHVIEVREALRALIDARAHGRDERNAARILDKAAHDGRLALRFEPAGSLGLVAEASGVAGAIGRILVHAFRAMVHGSWQRLKVCANDVCRWAFYDASRNRSGVWCSMAACGNRAKGRAYRVRRAAARATATVDGAIVPSHPSPRGPRTATRSRRPALRGRAVPMPRA